MSFEDSLQIIANMYDKEKAEFTQTANYLLSSTYILREDNKNRISKTYLFIDRHFELFYEIFSLFGWKIYRNKEHGVIYTYNESASNKLRLDKLSTVILLALRIIFEEKRVTASSNNNVVVTVSGVLNKIVNDFSIIKKKPSQKELKQSFGTFEEHNLIYKLGESFSDMDCKIVILPSILFAVSNEKCKNICEKIKVEKEQEDEEAEQVAVD